MGFQRDDFALLTFYSGGGTARGGTETSGDDCNELAVHGAAHDVTQDGAATADQCANHNEQVVVEHEPGCGGGPTGITVEHGDHDRHIGAADRHDHMNPEQ